MKERWSYFDQLDELEGVPVINIHLWYARGLPAGCSGPFPPKPSSTANQPYQ